MADAPTKKIVASKPAPSPAKDSPAALKAKAVAKAVANKAAKGRFAIPPSTHRKGRPGSPYDVVFHPMVTEKTMFNMDKNNSLEFLVAVTASKPEIKAAIEELFTVKVKKVTTRITHDGKRAVVRFAEGFSAEDVGMRIGVF